MLYNALRRLRDAAVTAGLLALVFGLVLADVCLWRIAHV